MSENEEPASAPGPGKDEPGRDNGRIVTDSPLPEDGAAAAPVEAATEDRTTPAASPSEVAGSAAGNGAVANGTNGSAGNGSANGSSSPAVPAEVPDAEPAAEVEPASSSAAPAAVSAESEPARPVPRPRPEAASPLFAAGGPGASSAAPQAPGDDEDTGAVTAPPPWRRAPGEEAAQAPRSPGVDSLLSEAPTAYIDRGRAGGPGSGIPQDRPTEHVEIPSVASRAPRQALLQVKRFDPWSVLKLALVLAVVLFLIWLVAVGVLYGVLDGMGVWDRLNGTYADLVSGGQQGGSALISAGSVFGIAAVIGAINSLLFAVAMTVGAFVYNVSADLVGGIEVTLSERD